MQKESDKLKSLKATYRQIFKQSALEIQSAVDSLSPTKVENYLKERFANMQTEAISQTNLSRKKCHCNNCGTCCRFAISEFSPEELQKKAQLGDNIAKQFTQTFIPYESKEDYSDIYPEYLELLKNETYYVYHCPKITKANRCPEYEQRPQICRDFPDNPLAFLPPVCGFNEWKLKSEHIWLRLRAEKEIIGFLLNKN